jgi:hypothetical protein
VIHLMTDERLAEIEGTLHHYRSYGGAKDRRLSMAETASLRPKSMGTNICTGRKA